MLSIEGTFVQDAAGRLAIELGGLAPGAQRDQLRVSGAVSLNGSLALSYVNGFLPNPGQEFLLIEGGSVNGTFSTVTGGTAPNGRVVTLSYEPTTVRAAVNP
ncbi:MAG: hypothetical protein FJ405_07180 [Verrucomicrobia bacterium]|nr:hypothetical protein [Verrucomicrobiota bacterium]